MKSKIIIVRTIGLTITSALVAVFVHAYGIMQANWLQYGLKIDRAFFPVPTSFFHRYSFLGYILPAAALMALLIKNSADEKKLPYIDVFFWFTGIMALAWLLACILAWQLPLYYPVADIR
jgi:hypothetical protein